MGSEIVISGIRSGEVQSSALNYVIGAPRQPTYRWVGCLDGNKVVYHYATCSIAQSCV